MTALGWAELVSTALVGTARRPVSLPLAETMAALLPAEAQAALVPPGTPPPATGGALLDAAGALALARRAGVAAAAGLPLPAAAPPERRPLVPPPAATRLDNLLGANDEDGLALWLTLAATRDLRVPGRTLPALFRIGRAHPALRAMIVSVAGARGRWLAAQREEWRPFADTVPAGTTVGDDAWTDGSNGERIAYLAAIRAIDPDRARELLIEAWPHEAPAERAAMLATLAGRLGPADEEFCDTALDDRRKEVRDVAASLLLGLDGSALRQRMASRARACVSRSGRKIVVEPPSECDAAMKRDGIDPKPRAGVGAKAWWLDQVVAAAPLSTWQDLADDPAALIKMKVADDWAPVLRRAWARAAARTHDVPWSMALLQSGFGRGKNVDIQDSSAAIGLYASLPPETAIAWSLDAVKRRDPDPTDLSRLLEACPAPWPPGLGTAMLTHLRDQALAARTTYVSPRLRELARTITSGLPIDAAADAIALANRLRANHDEPAVTAVMDAVTETVSVRYQMLMEFA